MTTDPAPDSHGDLDRDLQMIIDSLATSRVGRPADDLARELEQQLQQRGLPAMPDSWIRAVATQAAVGNPYVVSQPLAAGGGIPDPANPERPFGLG